jgi:hypothetical protein
MIRSRIKSFDTGDEVDALRPCRTARIDLIAPVLTKSGVSLNLQTSPECGPGGCLGSVSSR